MELSENMVKISEDQKTEEAKKFKKSAEKYASQGFDKDSIRDLLCLDGCSEETAKNLSGSTVGGLPDMYATSNPPVSFEDVRSFLKNTILTASIEDIENYFKTYTGDKFNGIKNRILLARDNGGDTFVSEVIQELEPFVDDLIVTNQALSLDEKVASAIDEKEKLEQNLFGVWPVNLVRERRNIDRGDQKIVNKSKVSVPGNISLI